MAAYDALPLNVRNKLKEIAWNIDPIGVYLTLRKGFDEKDIIEALQRQSDRQTAKLQAHLGSEPQTAPRATPSAQ